MMKMSIDWSQIDFLLCDMDGTLLDIEFDLYFWLQLLPEEIEKLGHYSFEEARGHVQAYSAEIKPALAWYCLDHWSKVTVIDRAALKRRVAHKITPRRGALEFLESVDRTKITTYLVTDAHPDTLKIKLQQVDLSCYFDGIISSHSLGLPKRELQFWKNLRQAIFYNPDRTLFIDDNPDVLTTAHLHGIKYLRQPIHQDTRDNNSLWPCFKNYSQLS